MGHVVNQPSEFPITPDLFFGFASRCFHGHLCDLFPAVVQKSQDKVDSLAKVVNGRRTQSRSFALYDLLVQCSFSDHPRFCENWNKPFYRAPLASAQVVLDRKPIGKFICCDLELSCDFPLCLLFGFLHCRFGC
jgi:hypothetical protein